MSQQQSTRALQNAIEKSKDRLSKKQSCENFGQNEVRKLKEKFIDISCYSSEMNEKRNLIHQFDNWCMSR